MGFARLLEMRHIGKSFSGVKILQGEEVPKEITLASRVFTADNIERGGEWLER